MYAKGLHVDQISQGSFPVPKWSYRTCGIIVQISSCQRITKSTKLQPDKLLEASKAKSIFNVHQKLEGTPLITTPNGSELSYTS